MRNQYQVSVADAGLILENIFIQYDVQSIEVIDGEIEIGSFVAKKQGNSIKIKAGSII
jgi:hypothetical protein